MEPQFQVEPRTTIALIFHHDNSSAHSWFRKNPFQSYLYNLRLVTRCILSLRAVGTLLPVSVLVSGERFPAFEVPVISLGARLIDMSAHEIRVPRWGHQHFRGSFHKLKALFLTDFRRVIVLDGDTIVHRNIDHLSGAPAPSFVYRPTPCTEAARIWRHWEMNSGVMVLAPSASELSRVQDLMRSPVYNSIGHRTDPSDQSVWRYFYEEVHELPRSYNMMAIFNMSSVDQWDLTHVLHDIESYRKVQV